MSRKSQPKSSKPQSTGGRSITPEQIAERRIVQWLKSDRLPGSWSYGHISHSKIRCLDFKNLGLRIIPPSLRNATDIELLDFEGNRITKLPPWLGELSTLTGLNLARNELRTLPDEIGRLKDLAVLFLGDNRLERSEEHTSELQ